MGIAPRLAANGKFMVCRSLAYRKATQVKSWLLKFCQHNAAKVRHSEPARKTFPCLPGLYR